MARKSRKNTQAEDSVKVKTAALSAWIYARISNDGNHSEDSIDNQIAICKEYINADSELTIGGIFTDLGFSGTDFERPGYRELMAGILSGEIDCVVVKDLSRIGRTYIEVGELIFDTFVQYRIRFISVNDQYDSFADDAGRKKLLVLFKNLVNHMYSRDLGKKIKSAHDAKKKRGEPAGAAPYGYRKSDDGKQLVIDDDAAEIVKMIFDMRLNGESVCNIAKNLNRQGIPTHQQRRYQLGEITHENYSERMMWRETFVSRILRNKVYTGSLIQGKYDCTGKKHKLLPRDEWIIHENTHEAIVTKEQFEEVERLMSVVAKKYEHKNPGKHPENRYAGTIICSRCTKTVLRSDNRLKNPILYYYSCRHCCDELKFRDNLARAPKLPLKKLDAIVMETLRKYLDALVQFDNLSEVLAKSNPLRDKRTQITKNKAKLEKIVDDAEKNLSTAYTHHLEGLLDLREYQIIRDKMENDKREAEIRLKIITNEQSRYDVNNVLNNQWLVKYSEFRDCEIPTKAMIQTLIKKIYLTPLTNEIEIELNFKDCFEELTRILQEGGITVNV